MLNIGVGDFAQILHSLFLLHSPLCSTTIIYFILLRVFG